jgi:peptide/nickel transport system permease protein
MALFTVFVVVSLSFFMIRLMPGNAVDVLAGQLMRQGGMTPQEIQGRLNAVFGIQPHAPLVQQYVEYLGHAARGQFGTSTTNPGVSVRSIVAKALPWTVFTVGVALILSFIIGIAIGTVMAALRNSRISHLATLVVSVISAIPPYVVAIVLIYFLATVHPIFPKGAAYSINVKEGWNLPFIESAISYAILPIICYTIVGFAGWALQMKGSAISTMGSEYVRAAEARGLSRRRIMQSYIGRNSMLPQVTLLGLSVGYVFAGSAYVEQLFGYPGIGNLLVTSVTSRDYPVMMGCFVVITVAIVIANLIVDLIYPLVDPRITAPGAEKSLQFAGVESTDSVAEMEAKIA